MAKLLTDIFAFVKQDSEVDTYMIKDPSINNAIMFIWDDDVTVKIGCDGFRNVKILNSKLTNELIRADSMKYALYIEPMKKLESQLAECKSRTPKQDPKSCDDIQLKLNQLSSENKDGYLNYIVEYVKTNPNSFVSLYYLTYGGDAFGTPEPAYVAAFRYLSPRLKEHSRARIYDQAVQGR